MCSNNWKEGQQHRFKIMERTKEEKFWMTAHYVIWQNINIVVSYLTSITRKIEQDLARAPLSLSCAAPPCASYKISLQLPLSLLCIDICVCLFHIICMSKGEGRQPRREALLSSLLYMSWKKIQRSMKEAPTASPKDMPEKRGCGS